MEKLMTIAEIKQVYDAEWVLIENPQTDDNLEVLAGTVTAHSKDRDEVYRCAVRRQPASSAIIYTGVTPEDAAIVL